MSSKKTSFRLVALFLTVIAVTAVTVNANWLLSLTGDVYASLFKGPEAIATSEGTPLLRVLTAGTCDTAGPIEVESSGGTAAGVPTAYATLSGAAPTGAFATINAGVVHTGVITIDVCGNTSEGSATATLNAGNVAPASWTSIVMSPAGGAARTITGATTAGNPLIDLSGADNVTIDGLNAGGNSLTLSNTTASATSGTSTIRFIGDATGNTITNSSIFGSPSMAMTTNGGIIFFSTSTTVGNDNNTISNSNIGPAGANLPSKAFYGNGSTTTVARGNSGIIISGNNIFDYYLSGVHAAIYTNDGNTDWTISNNKFYQSASRTLSASTASVIFINGSTTANNNNLISGNTIGFATNTGTGTYAIVGVSGSIFIPININAAGTTTATSIQGNTIAGIALSGAMNGTSSSAPFRAIYVNAGLTTVGDVTGNTIGSQSATGSITYTSSSTSASDVIGIFNFGSSNWTTNNNTVGGITAANSTTGASNIFGIRANTLSSATWTCLNNIVGGTIANSISSTTTVAGTSVQGIKNDNPIGTIRSNTIRNLTAAGGTSTGTSSSVLGIVTTTTATTHTIGQNTITNLANTNATTATVVTGIQFSGSTANVIERNSISGLSVASNSASAEINGIRIAAGTSIFRNNMINIGAGTSNAALINGIVEPAATGVDNFFHNSVFIGGTPTAGTGSSFAFNSLVVTSTRSFRNNIFYNARSNSGATGKNYAVQVGGSSANPTGLTINNNIYLANGSGAVFGRFSASDVANLSAWQTAVGQDAASSPSDPLFVSTSDLHLTTGSPARSIGATTLGVSNDFDGKTRPGADANFDIGADEFDGIIPVANDMAATAFIDPTSGGSKLAGASFSPQASFTNTGTSGQTSIPVRYRICTDASCTTEVYNQVVSIASLATLATTTSTFPSTSVATPGVYTIKARAELVGDTVPGNNEITGTLIVLAPLAGNYTVGVGGNYSTITQAVAALNSLGISGATTLALTDATYASETFPITLNAIAGSSAANTITIKPSPGINPSVSGSSASCLIALNGSDYVTLDGSNTVGGTTRDLTLTNTSSSIASAVVCLQTATADGATNNTVKNTRVIGSGNTATLFGIFSGANGTPSLTSSGTGNNSNAILNNDISKTQYGIYSSGASSGTKNTGNSINQNLINTVFPNNVQIGGIYVRFESGIDISQNNIANINTPTSTPAFGISLGLLNSNIFTGFTGSEVVGATVTKNVIDNIVRTGDASAAGISIAEVTTAASAANTLSNNMISAVRSTSATPSDFSTGILAGGGSGSTTRLYYNSVSATGFCSISSPCFAVVLAGSNPVMDVKNNIFYNVQTSTSGKIYAIGMVSSTFTNFTANNNLYFTNSANFAVTGGLAGTDRTFVTFKSTTGQDAASYSSDPRFLSTTNLHIDTAQPTQVESGGVSVAGFTTDIDGDTRNATTPDVGADEGAFTPLAIPGTLQLSSATYSGNEGTTLAATVSRINGTSGTVTVDYTLTNGTGAVGGAACMAGVDYINPGGAQTLTFLNSVSTQPINITLCPDAGLDDAETFTITLTNATGGAILGSPTAATATITDVPPPLATGTYNVPGDFGSLTNNGGIFARLNLSGATGDITVNIAADLTLESGTHALNALAGGHAVLIKPSAAPRSITGSIASNALIRTNGASRVTIDGSVSSGTDRSMTITNTSTTAPQVVRFGSIGTTAVTNNALKNCIIVNGVNTSSAVLALDTGGSSAGYFTNLAIQNNDIRRAYFGVFTNAAVIAGNGNGLSITGNDLNSTSTNAIRNVGIYVQGADGATVSANNIGNFETASAENDFGIWLASSTVNTTVSGNTISALGMTSASATNTPVGIIDTSSATASGNTISGNAVSNITNGSTATAYVVGIEIQSGGTTVERNNVSGINNTSTGTYGAYGINITSGSNVVVKNNFVSNVTGNMTGGDAFSSTFGIFGIRIQAGSGHKIYNNSVNLYGARAGTASSSLLTAALAVVATASTGIDIRNNILANNITGGTTSIANVSAYLPSGGTSAMNLTWNNNSYFFGTDAARAGAGQAGTTAGTNFFTTLALLKAYTSTLHAAGTNDNASLASTATVSYVSDSDLHITPGKPEVNTGATIATVTNDYEGTTRPQGGLYEIGADELPGNARLASISTTVGTLSPPFDPNFFSYTVNVSNATSTLNMTASTVDPAGYVSIAGAAFAVGTDTRPIALLVGSNIIPVIGRAEDGVTTLMYNVTIIRATPTPTNPTGIGAANPGSVPQGGSSLLTVTVTSGADPTSTGIQVTGDLTSIGGSATQTLFDNGTNGDVTGGDNIFSYDATVSIGTTVGLKSLGVSITDAQARSNTTSISLTVTDGVAPDTQLTVTPSDPSGDSTPTFEFSGVDSLAPEAVDHFECKLDSGSFGLCTSPYTLPTTAEGSHTLQVRAVDTAGNADPTPAGYTWTIAYVCTAPPANMTAWFDGSGPSPIANDIGGNHDGTLNNGAGFGTGMVGAGFTFDGVNDDITVPGTWGGTAEATIDAWVKTASASSTEAGIQSIVSSADQAFIHFQLSDNNAFALAVYTNAGEVLLPIPAQSPVGEWRHIAVTVKPGEQKVFVNGVQIGSTGTATYTSLIPTSNLKVGSGFGTLGGRHFNGQLDEIEIFDRALTTGEIQSIYNADAGGKCHTSVLRMAATAGMVGESAGNATFNVVRDGANDSAVSVNYTFANSGATGGASCGGSVDYVNTGGTVNFANGESVKSFTTGVCNDPLDEPDEDFTATLSGATGSATLGSPLVETMTILDDDSPNAAPFISTNAPASATEDTLYTYDADVTDVDGPGAVWSVVFGTDTCGGTIVPSTGVYTFTPTGPVPPAACTLAIRVDDGGIPNEFDDETVTITIGALNDPPVINSTAPPTATEDVLYTYNATRIDADGPGSTWSLSAGNTCAGATISPAGVYTFTPVGPVSVTNCVVGIRVEDGGTPNLGVDQNTPITIGPVNDAPVIDSTAPATATEGLLYTYNATRLDPDGPGQAWSVIAGTDTCGGSIVPSTGVYTFTPVGPVPPSTCTIAIRVNDGGSPDLSGDQSSNVTINPVNDPPVIDSTAPATATEDVLYTYNATRNDADGPGQNWSIIAGTDTCGGSVVPSTGIYTFTPSGPVPAATCVVAIQVGDGGTPPQTATQSTTITINAVNDPPSINSTALPTATEDTLYSYSATHSDPDGPTTTWSISAGNTCSGATISPAGLYTFMPVGPVVPANCVVGIRVEDGGTPNLGVDQNTTITINAVNDPPSINSTAPTTAVEDTLYTYLASSIDPDGPATNWSLSAGNTCLGASINSSGVYTFTPVGPVPQTTCVVGIRISDGATPPLGVDQNTTINITPINDAPVIDSSAPPTANEGVLYTYNATSVDPDGPVANWSVSPGNTCLGATISPSGVYTFNPVGPAPPPNCVVGVRVSDAGSPGLFADQNTTIAIIPSDATAPVIGYTPISNGSLNPALTVTGSDAVGITTMNIFWSVNGGSYTSAACSLSTGTVQSGTWSCQIAGMPSTASVAYYVTAQDAAANTGSNPAAGASTPNLFTLGFATVPAGSYENMSLGNGTVIGGAASVSNVLTLSGIVNAGANVITLGCTATVSGAGSSSYVIGSIEKQYCSVGLFVYPVGTTPDAARDIEGVPPPEFTPFTANITAGTFPSSLIVSVTDGFLPDSHTTQSASRYWNVTEVGDLTADISFAYLDQDINGSEGTYRILRRSGSTTSVYTNGTVTAATNTVIANGVTNFSGWAAGNLSPTAVSVGISGRVTTATGQGIRNATVTISGGNLPFPRKVVTGSLGIYNIGDLESGRTYVISVSAKRFRFADSTRVVTLSDSIADFDFLANP